MREIERDYVFVSYSHSDEQWLARLQVFLKPFPWGASYKQGGRLWADPYLQVGERWAREIDVGLARARIAVLLISQDFLASEFVQSVELPALLERVASDEVTLVCIPVSSSTVSLVHPQLLDYQWPCPADEPLNLRDEAAREAALARIACSLHKLVVDAGLGGMATASLASVPHGREGAVSILAGEDGRMGKLFGVPEQRPHFVERRSIHEHLREVVLTSTRASVGLTSSGSEGRKTIGMHGQGGLGKTVTAIALVHDEALRRAFPDGIYWLTLGQEPDIATLQSTLIGAVAGERTVIESEQAGTAQLKALLAERACLVVLDDLWRYEHARAFDVLGPKCRLLTTTRDASLLTALAAEEVELERLEEGQALALLSAWTGIAQDRLPPEAKAVAAHCDHLPLALSVSGAMARDGTAWEDLLAALEAGKLGFLEHPYASVFTVLRRSLDGLEDSLGSRYLELAVFPEDVHVPSVVIERLWAQTAALQAFESRQMLQALENKGLLYIGDEGDERGLRFHDLQRDFLQLAADNVAELHSKLLAAYVPALDEGTEAGRSAWWTLPRDEPYVWEHLCHHLARAERSAELRELLLNPHWMRARLEVSDINGLLVDYEAANALLLGDDAPLGHDESVNVVGGALRLSAHVLARDETQLASQLIGRLFRADSPAIHTLLKEVDESQPRPWLRPLAQSLAPPGGALLRTLEGHTDGVRGVAVTPDGARAVSASQDKTLKVWDLASGAVVHTLEGHTAPVDGVAVTPDGARAVSAAWDNTLKVWDLASGAVVHTLEGHTDWVRGVAVTPDGACAVSASQDKTLKVWDLASGAVAHTLEGHTDEVDGVAVTPDGARAVSASHDNTLKVWDLASGAVVHTLEGHTGKVTGVAVTPDGAHAVSASWDNTFKVWDLASGAVVHTLEGHTRSVDGVAVTPDGARAVSASWDNTLKVWDLATGAVVHALEGHTGRVGGVAVTSDGAHAVSASHDNTLKVWDLASGAVAHTLEGHTDEVTGVAVTPDGARAVSASRDKTLKVWDLASGAVVHTLEGHTDWVRSVVVTPDGTRAVSASDDSTLKVWDLASGAVVHTLECHTLEGHTGYVTGVAVTPDGARAVSASRDKTLKVWDLASGSVVHTLEGHTGEVDGVAVTPDGARAISASSDNTLKMWDLASGSVVHTLEGHTAGVIGVAVTPDGARAVSASWDNTLKVWDLASGAVVHTLEGHTASVRGVAVTPDGARAVSASSDKTLKVWDLALSKPLVSIDVDVPINCCTVCSDARRILAGDALGRVHFLRVEDAS